MPSHGYGNHPMVKYVRSLQGEYYLTREVADRLDCTVYMLMWMRKHQPALGSTHQASYGGIVMHLYTPERIAAIEAYIATTSGRKGHQRRGKPSIWTRSEQITRRRQHARLRAHRLRAEQYTADGEIQKADRQYALRDALAAEMAEATAVREKQLGGRRLRP